MNFDYGFKELLATPSLQGMGAPTRAETAAVSIDTPPEKLTKDEIARIRTLPQPVQDRITLLASNTELSPGELAAQVRAVLQEQQTALPPQTAAAEIPLGHDAMVATPTGQALATSLGQAQSAQRSGRSSFSEQDIALLKSQVESGVKQMMASGAPDAQIQQAVAQMAGNSDLAPIAHEIAQQQLDADKFNMFSTRNQQSQTQENAVMPLMTMVAGAAALETMPAPAAVTTLTTGRHAQTLMTVPGKDNNYDVPNHQLPWKDLGDTLVSIARDGLPPVQAGLPNLKSGPAIGTGRSGNA